MDLKQGFVHVIDEREFDTLIEQGKPLRVKAGFDPTTPDLHLGHAVLLKKLREFQDEGHTVVLIVGDTTASIGDPTGQNKLRPALSVQQIEENGSTYMAQAFKILEPALTVVKHNSEWFNEMKISDVIRLMSNFTLSQLEARDNFKERKAACTAIFMHELLYPMLQAYDSFREGIDLELGGDDQFYNMMLGRMYMHDRGEKSQVFATTPLLLGTDGIKKMSKSLGNHISLTEKPLEMFSKVMSISDETMLNWRKTLFPEWEKQDEVAAIRSPMMNKIMLAHSIVAWLNDWDDDVATAAEEEWTKIFSKREKPTDIPSVKISATLRLDRILAMAGMASSVTEAGRLIKNGAVDINGIRVTSHELSELLIDAEIKVGKQWKKITQG